MPTNELSPHLNRADLQLLEEFGSADIEGDRITPRFAIFAAGDVLAVIPRPTCFDEVVYLGPDSKWLVEVACRLAPGGDRAVELGAGHGYLSAALSNRYRFTLATDVRPWTAAVAAITLAMNMQPAGKSAVCAADVARGLRPRSFDLVTGNPPWVPNRDETRARRLFADGGPTGFELPRRFISEGSALIAPGGIGMFNCVDARFSGGREPLVELIRELELDGCGVEIEEVPGDQQWPDRTEELGALNPDLERARLVSVVVKRW
ncbi:MAG: methyltransferase [Actinomycetota bacterium]